MLLMQVNSNIQFIKIKVGHSMHEGGGTYGNNIWWHLGLDGILQLSDFGIHA